MKKLLLPLLLAFCANIQAQSEYTLPQLTHLPQSAIQVNPAIFTDHKVNVVLPNFYFGAMNSSFQLGDVLTETKKHRRLLEDLNG